MEVIKMEDEKMLKRGLKGKDIFMMSKIIKKMKLKINANDEKTIDENGKEVTVKKTQQQVGAELILSIFENLHLAENEVNTFLSSMTGLTVDEISDLPIDKMFSIIGEFKDTSGITGFLKQASQ